MRDVPITVVVPVKNEEANLARCLSRLGRFAQVIVVDSKSTDLTPQIATDHGATVLNFDWNGHYPKKRNWVLLNHKLACDWVLFLDADEFVDDAFCTAAAKAVGTATHNGYWLSYTNWFLGQRLRFGLPQKKLALFRVGSGLYERIDEDAWSRLDMEIHEHPIINGSVGEITSPIDHNDDRGVAKFIDRHRDYALWEARRAQALKAGGSSTWESLTGRQQFKYRNIEKFWFPAFYFLLAYVAKGGFLDGRAGFAYAFYKLWYFYTIKLLIQQDARQGNLKAKPGAM